MTTHKIFTPIPKDVLAGLRAGDLLEISGSMYTARDAAHKRMMQLLAEGKPFPFEVRDSVIYYVGPCPARPGQVIGSAGPTTSGRVDGYTVPLLERGLAGMIGKGNRSQEVIAAMLQYKAVYMAAIGGAGALLAGSIKSQEVIAFPELGTEAIRRLVVEDFPVIVVIDTLGNNLYESERKKYRI